MHSILSNRSLRLALCCIFATGSFSRDRERGRDGANKILVSVPLIPSFQRETASLFIFDDTKAYASSSNHDISFYLAISTAS